MLKFKKKNSRSKASTFPTCASPFPPLSNCSPNPSHTGVSGRSPPFQYWASLSHPTGEGSPIGSYSVWNFQGISAMCLKFLLVWRLFSPPFLPSCLFTCLKTETTAMYHFAHITYGWQSILGRWYFCLCRIQLHKRLRHPKIFKLVIFLNEFSKRTPRVSVEMSSGNPMRCNACQKMSIFPLKFKFFPIFSKCRMLSAKAIE